MGAVTMFVLVVEDEADFIEELRQICTELPGTTELLVATSRGTAFTSLDTGFFDLVVLDLNIPTFDGALDADPEHGHAVFARARAVAPGTPIFVLTGSPVEDFIPAMLQQKQQVDIWGEGRKVGSVDFLKKYKIDECSSKLGLIAAAVHALSEVELDRGGINPGRSPD
jgi:CheY-like chemotaxis protein